MWRSIQRLLLCSEPIAEPEALLSVLHSVSYALPHAHLTLLQIDRPAVPELHLEREARQLRVSSVIAQPSATLWRDAYGLIDRLRQARFEAAVIFTASGQSPYSLAYLCHLAGIPVRVGQSLEFGGGTLSLAVKPPIDPVDTRGYYRHLLRSAGILQDLGDRSPSLETATH